MKNFFILASLWAACAVAVAAAPTECDKEKFDYQVDGRDISINHCYFKVAQDGRHFDQEMKAGRQYVGIYDFTNREWLLEPVHKSVTTFQKDRFLTLGHDERFYRYYDLKTKAFSNSNISRIVPYPYAAGDKHVWSVFELDGDSTHIGLYNFRDGSIYKSLKNVDKDIGGGEARPIKPVYTAREGGYIVRQVRPDGSKYYKAYSDAAEELTGEIDAARVYPFAISIREGRNAIGSSYVFFEKVDENRKLFWPIFFDDTTLLKRPDNLRGIRVDHTEPSLSRFSGLDEFIIEFSDSRYLGYQKASIPEDIGDRIAFFSDQSRKLVDAELVDLPTPLVTGAHFTSKRRILVFEDRIELPHLKKSFKSRPELQAFLDDRLANIEKLAADEKREHEKSMQAFAARQKEKEKANKPMTAQEFIERMHQHGPSTESLQAFYYDVGVYCQYRGPRCSAYQAQYRAMENSRNQASELANQRRINSYASGGGGGASASTRAPSESTERYNAAVKRAADKERDRVRDEQWKKR
ncbi:hypothetical protein [Piscinibacter sakaiensis]|uniref:hypothetical protein n=1 Tax=Piscinibacter sakaiensis TaxID=1547922 RepID=UPI003AAC0DFE